MAISNIGWTKEQDEQVYSWMDRYGFTGLEIAPTRIFPTSPYDRLQEAKAWSRDLKSSYGFTVPSMQSIWYGHKEKLFGTEAEREILLSYTKKAIDFAVAIGCSNLVFGCPGSRAVPEGMLGTETEIAAAFFKAAGDYAAEKGTVIGMEANPQIYNTNYINDTMSALELIERVDSKGFRLNLDIGAMISNGEPMEELRGRIGLVNHVHISEPHLVPIRKRALHKELKRLLEAEGYERFVSIEMGRTEHLRELEQALAYIREVFGE